MYARCRSRRRHQAEAAVEQGVVILESEFGPGLFVEAGGIARQVHVLWDWLAKSPEGELRPPVVIVGQLEQIGLHQRNEHHRPGPVVLVDVEEAAFRVDLLGDRPYWRHAALQHRLMS